MILLDDQDWVVKLNWETSEKPVAACLSNLHGLKL